MANINRRGFLAGLMGVSIATIVPVTANEKGKEPAEKKLMALTVRKCPKCGGWMHLPTEARFKGRMVSCNGDTATTDGVTSFGREQEVPITCKCMYCKYQVTEKVLCMVSPRVEAGHPK